MAPPRNPGIGEWSSTRWAFDPSMRYISVTSVLQHNNELSSKTTMNCGIRNEITKSEELPQILNEFIVKYSLIQSLTHPLTLILMTTTIVLHRRCVSFDYRGLRGNSNNFLTKEICEKKCPGQHINIIVYLKIYIHLQSFFYSVSLLNNIIFISIHNSFICDISYTSF